MPKPRGIVPPPGGDPGPVTGGETPDVDLQIQQQTGQICFQVQGFCGGISWINTA